jgi:6-phosphogluconolactonase
LHFNKCNVTCVDPTYTIGGTITGIAGFGNVILRDPNAASSDQYITLSADGAFTFPGTRSSGYTYNIVVSSGGTTTRTCHISNGGNSSGMTSNVTNIAVNCVGNFTLGGTITGISGNGTVILRDYDAPLANKYITLSTDGAFTFPGTRGGGYTYQIDVYPGGTTSLTCTIANDTDSVGMTANVTNITVTCM